MKKEIKKLTNLKKLVRLEKAKILKQVQDDKFGFTLAEVLITLGIIGVVAALTVPSLVAKYQEKVAVNQLKRTYSILSNAWQMVEAEYGTIDTWGLNNTSTDTKDEEGNPIYNKSAQSIIAQRLKPYLKVAKTCELNKVCLNLPEYSKTGEKLSDGTEVFSDKWDSPPEANFFLNDGTYMGIGYYSDSSKGANVLVILPSSKKIILGRTKFFLNIYPNRVIPEGDDNICKDCFKYQCYSNGRSCAAWVIYNENMDYLHCDDLSWNGKHKCSD